MFFACSWYNNPEIPWDTHLNSIGTSISVKQQDEKPGHPIYFGHLMWRTDWLEKTLRKIEGRRKGNDRGWDSWMASLTQWTWIWASSRSWYWTGKPSMLQSMGWQSVEYDWATEVNSTHQYHTVLKLGSTSPPTLFFPFSIVLAIQGFSLSI